LQRLAADLGVSYNTARSRLDEIVAAVGGQPGTEPAADRPDAGLSEGQSGRLRALEAVAAGEITPHEAMRRLRAERERS
jgi:hypothetical protein